MRHNKKINHLGRKTAHRSAMLANMATSLIVHKRINTTVAKAKALKRFVEPLITKCKTDNTHNRRVVFSYLRDKDAVSILFNEVAQKVADRPGGYTRIIKTGFRLGDAADMAMIELVDFNEIYSTSSGTKKTRRSRRGKSGGTKAAPKKEENPVEEVEAKVEDTKVEEAQVEETKAEETKVEEAKAEETKAEETKADDIKTEVEDTKADEVEAKTAETEEAAEKEVEPEKDNSEDADKSDDSENNA